MSPRARFGLALLGLAVAAPCHVWADPPTPSRGDLSASAPAVASVQPSARAPVSKPVHKHRWKPFGGNDMCVDCQRARLKAKTGIDMPPPPPMPTSVTSTMPAPTSAPAPTSVAECTACQGGDLATNDAGYAVVGEAPPGYALVGGAVPLTEPMPIGMVSALPGGPMMGMGMPQPGPQGPARGQAPGRRGRGRGLSDPSVMASSFAPASDPIASPRSGSPHVLRHLLGLNPVGRRSAEERERRKRENHAMTSYGAPTGQVNDLPASMVYSQGGR